MAPKRRSYWWSGAAFAGVGLAGVLAGALTMSLLTRGGTAPAPRESSYLNAMNTSFGGAGSDWSEPGNTPGADGSDE